MKNETEIIEGNKLIAEFMNHEEDYDEHGVWQKLQYHSSWDWLMPVVEKIKSGKVNNEAFGSVHVHMSATGFQAKWNCSILGHLTYRIPINIHQHTYKEVSIPHISVYNESSDEPLIKCTWLAVTEFIKWYNLQPPSQG
jgi:hypothetical protein